MKKLYLFVALLSLVLFSCKKDKNTGPAPEKTYEIVNVKVPPNTDGVVSIYRLNDYDLDINFHGKAGADGNISEISGAILTKKGSDYKDYITFDKEQRVRTHHTSKGGVNDSLLYKYSYQDTTYTVSVFKVDWQTGESILQKTFNIADRTSGPVVKDLASSKVQATQQTDLKRIQRSTATNAPALNQPVSTALLMDDLQGNNLKSAVGDISSQMTINDDAVRSISQAAATNTATVTTAFRNTLKFMLGVAVISIGGSIGGAAGVAIGVGGALYAYYSNAATINNIVATIGEMAGEVVKRFISDASASDEIDWSKYKEFKNPGNEIAAVAEKNPKFDWCPCYVDNNLTDTHLPHLWKSSWVQLTSGSVEILFDLPLKNYVWPCNDITYAYHPGFVFLLKPGNVASYRVAYQLAADEECGLFGGEYANVTNYACN